MSDEQRARHYHEHGYTHADIAVILGCSAQWVYYLLNPDARARLNARSRAWMTSGTCARCGGQMTRNKQGLYTTGKPYVHCGKCRAELDAEAGFARRVQGDTLLCRTCHVRKPFSAYPQRMVRRFLERRKGRAPRCTACDTAARIAYRERHRVPCLACGRPRTGDGKRRNQRGIDTGLCRDCYQGRTEVAA